MYSTCFHRLGKILVWGGQGSRNIDFTIFPQFFGAFEEAGRLICHCSYEILGNLGGSGGRRSKNIDFHYFFIVFETRDVLLPPGDEKFSRWINSAAPSRSLKTQARFFDYTFLFELFFKSCDFGPSWGVAHGGDFLWWKIFADWKINYLLHSGVMSEVDRDGNIDFSWFGGGLRDGDVDFSMVFWSFLVCRRDGWRYRF